MYRVNETNHYNMNNNDNYTFDINQSLSVYINSVDNEYANEEYIKILFHTLSIGLVKNVYFEKFTNKSGWHCIIYMHRWYVSEMVENLQKKIINPELDARLVYNDPNYWLLHVNSISQYTSNLNNLNHIYTYLTEQTKNIADLETKNKRLEDCVMNMNWYVKLHEANIKYIAGKLNSDIETSRLTEIAKPVSKNTNLQLYTNNSCCGAVTDAWVPSNPSTNNTLNTLY